MSTDQRNGGGCSDTFPKGGVGMDVNNILLIIILIIILEIVKYIKNSRPSLTTSATMFM